MRVSSLHIYPIKGGRAVNLSTADVHERGFDHDRRWLATDENDQFLTQRSCPKLAQLVAAPSENGLRLSIGGGAPVEVLKSDFEKRRVVKIWKDDVAAVHVGEAAAAWLSEALGRPAQLYFMDDQTARQTSGNWGTPAPVSFADGYPFLITTTASLLALNEEIQRNGGALVGMERFRPNIVIDGVDPWAEDKWASIKIGDVEISIVKPCVRCEVTTKDQSTGERTGKEPLKSLAKLRRSDHPDLNGVLFGGNGFPTRLGSIKHGDQVEVLERRPEGWPLC